MYEMIKKTLSLVLLTIVGLAVGCRSLSAVDPDQTVLDSLLEAGSDFAQIHPFDFYIYHPKESGARQICDQLRAKSFQVSDREAATGSDWLCFASLRFVPSIDKLAEIRITIDALTTNMEVNMMVGRRLLCRSSAYLYL